MKTELILTIILIGVIVGGVCGVFLYKSKVDYRSFLQKSAYEECLKTVSDPDSNWMTRKGTVQYCSSQAEDTIKQRNVALGE